MALARTAAPRWTLPSLRRRRFLGDARRKRLRSAPFNPSRPAFGSFSSSPVWKWPCGLTLLVPRRTR
eukprot:12818733-Alexandrium_andersonii.AAC.1